MILGMGIGNLFRRKKKQLEREEDILLKDIKQAWHIISSYDKRSLYDFRKGILTSALDSLYLSLGVAKQIEDDALNLRNIITSLRQVYLDDEEADVLLEEEIKIFQITENIKKETIALIDLLKSFLNSYLTGDYDYNNIYRRCERLYKSASAIYSLKLKYAASNNLLVAKP